ncbi:MAG: lytic transglycosylase domain-containing protein, partial [Rhodospirillaceae bacterium]
FYAAAAFWAARANLVIRQPSRVAPFLEAAAARPRTFYGLLALHMLGRPMPFQWAPPRMDGASLSALTGRPRGKRAIALMQIDELGRAGRELRNLTRGADETLSRGVLSLAAQAGMAELAVRLDARLYPNGGGFDGAAYPIPGWTPAGGFHVDRALVYALIRQESRFDPKAKSWAGARGLMQLMPGTARFVARTHRIGGYDRGKLYQPETNLTLGQRYIEMLLADGKINGDLFLAMAAWNGGPCILNKWRRRTDDLGDPLFFIESLPSRETRNFIEHVLSNLWIYRHRLGQPQPSLAAIAAGEWPVYTPLGQNAVEEVAVNDGTRN